MKVRLSTMYGIDSLIKKEFKLSRPIDFLFLRPDKYLPTS
jgi:hypothetical protein